MTKEMINEIVDFMIDAGTSNSSAGSWYVDFEEISDCFEVSEEEVKANARDIIDVLDGRPEILSETWIDDDAFSLNLCGYAICEKCGGKRSETCVDCEVAHDFSLDKILVQRVIDGEIFPKIMTASEVVNYINMDDCHGEQYELFDVTSEIGKVKPLHYTGWQRNCLIEIEDEFGNVVVEGYGEDH